MSEGKEGLHAASVARRELLWRYYASPHVDSSDTKHSFILWFKTSTSRGGEFVILEWNLFIKPSEDTILLFDSTKIWHYTRGNFGFEQIGVASVLKEIIIRKALEKLQRQMKGPSVLVEQRRKIKAEGRKIGKEIKLRKMSENAKDVELGKKDKLTTQKV